MRSFIRHMACATLLFLIACQPQNNFHIKGHIAQSAANDTVWLEITEIDKNRVIDSVVLTSKGTFSFKNRFIGYPEFYTLRYRNQKLLLLVDSARDIHIESSHEQFAEKAEISGSTESKLLQETDQKTADLNRQLLPLLQKYDRKELDDSCFLANVDRLIDQYKAYASPQIAANLKSLSSYYMLFQRIGNYSIYKYYDRSDNRLFTALTNSFDQYYPQSPRTQHLHNLTLQGISYHQQEKINNNLQEKERVGSIDITLSDRFGHSHTLTALKGKVVLLDFTVYQSDYSPMRTIALNELYDKYKEKGFEIYQVSLDPDEHFWKTASDKLPWISVRDARSNNSPYIVYYNITKLPAYFLIDREGNIVLRDVNIADIETEVSKLLDSTEEKKE